MPENWPFEDAPDVTVFTTRQVVEGGQSVLLVSHDQDDGAWQFVHGGPAPDINDARLLSLQEIVRRDPSLRELADLPLGWQARRDGVGLPWTRYKSPDA